MAFSPNKEEQKMTTLENPVMQLHDIAGEQFVKAVSDIIVTTLDSEKCDDAINEIIKEYISDESIMSEDDVDNKIESAIDEIDWSDKIDDAIDWSEKINEAIDENDAFDLEEKVRIALLTQLGDTPIIAELRRDIHDLKMECNSLREHNKKSLDMVSSLLELIKVINNK
jgi:hypothetical protein